MRAALNDAAYKNLRYVPYSSTMPVTKKTEDARFMWVSLLLPIFNRLGKKILLENCQTLLASALARLVWTVVASWSGPDSFSF